jgi:hypothetical protein
MKQPRTAVELADMIRTELSQHHDVPAAFAIVVVPDGDGWRASCRADPEAPEQGELIAHAVEIGDALAHSYDLTT